MVVSAPRLFKRKGGRDLLVLGCLTIILGCGGLGLILAKRIRQRPEELRQCITAISLLDTEIQWGATPLPEALSMLELRTDGSWPAFFAEVKNLVLKGESAGKAWSTATHSQAKKFSLKKEDWVVIRDIGKGLGRSDRQEQHKQLELVQRQLMTIKEEASVWAEKQAKMWTYLGFLCGMAAVIFLI